MKIAGYLKTSLIEWPGKISSVIFVPGCNFRCPFCHNADLVNPKRGHRLPLIGQDEIFADLKKRKKWVDGVVVTGGEPTLQTDLSRFLSRLKRMGFLTMIETNGSKPEIIALLLAGSIIDYIAMDYKGNFDSYQNFTNVKTQNSNVKSSMKLILKSGIDFEFRTTVVPGLHNEQVLIQMAKELKQISNFKWYLQNFQPKNCLDPKFEKIKPFSRREVENLLKATQKIIPGAELRGI